MRTIACQMADARGRSRHGAPRRRRRRRASTSIFQATGQTYEFLGYRARTSKASTRPTPSSRTARRSCPRSPRASPVACTGARTRRPRDPAAGALHRGEPREGARGARHRSPVDVRRRSSRRSSARDYVWKKGNALVPTWTAFAKTQLLERYFAHLVDYELHRDDGGGARRHRARRGRGREVAALLLLRERHAGLRELVLRRPPRDDRLARGEHDPDRPTTPGHEIIVRVWRNGASVVRGDEKAPVPARPRARRADGREGRGADRQGRRRAARARHRPRHRTAGARAHRPLRPVRAARRAWTTVPKEKPKRASLFVDHGPDDGHARRGARSCCRCRASSATTPTATRSLRRTAATGPT